MNLLKKSLQPVLFRSIWLTILFILSCAVCAVGRDDHLFPIRENGKMGFADKTGTVIIPYRFDEIAENFSEGTIAVKIGEK